MVNVTEKEYNFPFDEYIRVYTAIISLNNYNINKLTTNTLKHFMFQLLSQ